MLRLRPNVQKQQTKHWPLHCLHLKHRAAGYGPNFQKHLPRVAGVPAWSKRLTKRHNGATLAMFTLDNYKCVCSKDWRSCWIENKGCFSLFRRCPYPPPISIGRNGGDKAISGMEANQRTCSPTLLGDRYQGWWQFWRYKQGYEGLSIIDCCQVITAFP